jgi:regulatory protein
VVAVRLLARREYGRAELAQRLLRRGADALEVERTLDRLETQGYLSDARFAGGVVAQRIGRYGKRAIAHELRERGVAEPAAREALTTLEGRDELADARALRERRFAEPPKNERDKARQFRFLLSRGFAAGIALRVLREAGVPSDEEAASDPGS